MERKFTNLIIVLLIASMLTACSKSDGWTIINGEKLKTDLISSGYYFDKASLSDIQVLDLVDRIETIKKPEKLGEVTFEKNIEDFEFTSAKATEVTDKDIEAKIESIRDDYQEEKIVTSKRGTMSGDKVIMNYTGKLDGIEFPGGSAVDAEVTLGDGSMLPDFEKGIMGKKPGVDFTIYVSFPEDYDEPSLRGKKAAFSCLIKYIKEKVTPEVNEEFIMAHSKTGATTSEAYREEIKEEIEFRKEYAIKENLRTQLFNEIYKVTKATPSEDAFAWQFTKLVTEQKRLADLRDVSYEEQMTNGYYAMRDVLSSYKLQAEQYLIEPMILDELSRKYHVTYTDEDKMQWFKDLCVYQEYGDDVTYELYSNSMGEPYIYDNGRKAKVMDAVLEHVKVTYEDSTEEEN